MINLFVGFVVGFVVACWVIDALKDAKSVKDEVNKVQEDWMRLFNGKK